MSRPTPRPCYFCGHLCHAAAYCIGCEAWICEGCNWLRPSGPLHRQPEEHQRRVPGVRCGVDETYCNTPGGRADAATVAKIFATARGDNALPDLRTCSLATIYIAADALACHRKQNPVNEWVRATQLQVGAELERRRAAQRTHETPEMRR